MRPRRALLITSNFPRWEGDTTTPFVLRLAQDLQAQGWGVDVLAPHAPGALRRETLAGVDVRRFRYFVPASGQTVCYGGGALINLRQSRSNWVKVPLLVAAELVATLRLLMRRRYAIVNAHWILPQGFVAAIAGWLTQTPVVTTIHGGDVFDLQGGIFARFKSWALRHSRAVTVNSSATRDAAISLAPDSSIATIPMGVDPPAAADRTRVAEIRHDRRRGQGPFLLFVGRLIIEKGIDDLLAAVSILAPVLPDVTLGIVGAGQDRAELETLAEQYAIEDRVFFTGWLERDEVQAYMAAADALIGPSKRAETGWREGLGLVFLEALAAGTPVIASASGGIPDIVRDGDTGLLVAEAAPDQIADAVRRLREDPRLVDRLVAAGQALVAERYTRSASATRFANLFDEIREQR
jgi:phosphatidylinositol alpha-1,6-mannosyltransferase